MFYQYLIEKIGKAPDTSRINIALYHGSISGVKTDTGWTMEHGEDDINIFNNFDYGFLGDIHKTNQSVDKFGKIRYPGSTVQQNHGETNDKGFLLWDILDKENFTCRHVELKNPKPFVTVNLTPKGRLPNKVSVAPGSRLRLLSENNLPLDVIRKAVDASKVRFKPEAVTYLNRSAGEVRSIQDLTDSLKQEDLRDLAVQEELISEYIIDFQPEDDILKKIFELNKKYNAIIENEEETYRNVNWKLKKLEWDNLFNYGEKNSINFENLNGIVGIFGKNFSGKSSIIDALLYTVFNTTSKNNRKNLNIINQNKQDCRGYVEIDIGTKTYKIERTSAKYKKKLKGKETLEAKTDLEFLVTDNATKTTKSLNGISRNETDKNIRKVFGSIEDFLMTSMTSQLDSLAYINEGSTRRKEILAKFLDLEFFDKKFKMVKEDTADFKGALRNLSNINYDEEIKEARTDLARLEAELSVKSRNIKLLQQDIDDANDEFKLINEQIDSIPSEFTDIRDVKSRIKNLNKELDVLKEENEEKNKKLREQQETQEKINNFIDNFNIQDFNNKKQAIEKHKEKLVQIVAELKKLDGEKSSNDKKINFLKKVPCSYADRDRCFFVKDARTAIEDSKRVKITTNQLSLGQKTLSKKVQDMNPSKIDEYLEKYELILAKRSDKKNKIIHLELECEKNKTKILFLESELAILSDKEQKYEDNKEIIDNLENLLEEKAKIKNKISNLQQKHKNSSLELMKLYKSNGSLEQKFNEIEKRKQEFCDLENEFTVADLYMRCMHPNGISYDVIKKRLPIINDEISKILANIVDFEIFFENDEKKLDILIKHPKHEPRPIEMGSGAEKTIAAVAIRLALLNVTTLPKGDIFILDEPGTALDADNMEGFIRILDMIKSHFKTVLLISHLESLKDVVDKQIIIEKQKGLAYVNE
jgi:DNA repair exonuclease SbcCD ATPase subunit